MIRDFFSEWGEEAVGWMIAIFALAAFVKVVHLLLPRRRVVVVGRWRRWNR